MRPFLFAIGVLNILFGCSNIEGQTTKPGQCTTTKDCAQYGSQYSCIAVQSTIAGISLTSQCVSGVTCGGNTPGKCPTFSSWPSNYQKLQPVCAFAPVTNCVNPILTSSTGSGSSGNRNSAGSNTVDCFSVNFTVNNISKVVNGIYKCIDAVQYVNGNGGFIQNFTQTQMDSCQGLKSANATLCNGHGTCAPIQPFSPVYNCRCNAGYSTDNNCLNATSNSCDNFGSCGPGNTCDSSSGTCKCVSGAKGNQCSQCDASASNVCSGNGKCNDNGMCTCNSGYSGNLCTTFSSSNSNTNNNHASSVSIAPLMYGITLGMAMFLQSS